MPAPGLRREIHGGLQVMEDWNSANTVLHYGKDGALIGPDKEHAETSMLVSVQLASYHVAQESATVADSADECKLWENLEPDDRLWPLANVPLTKMDELREATGRFIYVVLPNGELRVTRLGGMFGHSTLPRKEKLSLPARSSCIRAYERMLEAFSGDWEDRDLFPSLDRR